MRTLAGMTEHNRFLGALGAWARFPLIPQASFGRCGSISRARRRPQQTPAPVRAVVTESRLPVAVPYHGAPS